MLEEILEQSGCVAWIDFMCLFFRELCFLNETKELKKSIF